jgi:hypothetical protein
VCSGFSGALEGLLGRLIVVAFMFSGGFSVHLLEFFF